MSCRYPQWNKLLNLPKLEPDEKVRIGFISGYFREHSVWKIPLKGWIENLNREKFELFGYYTDSIKDEETGAAQKNFAKFIQGPLNDEQWCQLISDDKLHVLIFSEFGMDPMTFRLGCLRLAPIQVAAAGHPETSGLETIDYFLSSDLMEPENADAYYTEELVRIPNLGVHYTPLEISPEPSFRHEISITDDDVMFWCCQTLFKYLPQHDDVFPKIACKLKNARFVFIEYPTQYITAIFKKRQPMPRFPKI
jgi:predicted O-linked N-acetylglucosamine transferase (SPINDLY family)